MDELDRTIRDLKNERASWQEEYDVYGPNGTAKRRASAMSCKDIKFLTKQIDRLEKIRSATIVALSEVRQAIVDHRKTF